jgi:hypothetical protein
MPDLHNALPALTALAASIVLLFKLSARLFPVIALIASALELLRALAMLNLKVPVIGAVALFGAAMLLGGAGSWVKSSGKIPVTAATVVAFIGLFRLLRIYI